MSRSDAGQPSPVQDRSALLERFYNHGVIKSLMSASQDGSKVQNGIPIPSKHSSYIDSKSFAVALLGSLDKNKPIPEIADIEKMVKDATLPDVVRNVLSGALLTAGNDITKVRDQIADWFDDIMDRLNGGVGDSSDLQRRLDLGRQFIVARSNT